MWTNDARSARTDGMRWSASRVRDVCVSSFPLSAHPLILKPPRISCSTTRRSWTQKRRLNYRLLVGHESQRTFRSNFCYFHNTRVPPLPPLSFRFALASNQIYFASWNDNGQAGRHSMVSIEQHGDFLSFPISTCVFSSAFSIASHRRLLPTSDLKLFLDQ